MPSSLRPSVGRSRSGEGPKIKRSWYPSPIQAQEYPKPTRQRSSRSTASPRPVHDRKPEQDWDLCYARSLPKRIRVRFGLRRKREKEQRLPSHYLNTSQSIITPMQVTMKVMGNFEIKFPSLCYREGAKAQRS